MEIETISNYEENREKRLNNTMDVDLNTNDKESNFPPNKVYEDNSESSAKESEGIKEDKRESKILESESDDECEEEEEEEELLLSPAHSDYGGEPLSPVNRDLLDSDCEGEKVDFVRSTETSEDQLSESGMNENCIQKGSSVTKEDKTEINITKDQSEVRNNIKNDDATEVEPTVTNDASDENEINKDDKCSNTINIETEEGGKTIDEEKIDSPRDTEVAETSGIEDEDEFEKEKNKIANEQSEDNKEKIEEEKNAAKLGDSGTTEVVDDEESKELIEVETDEKIDLDNKDDTEKDEVIEIKNAEDMDSTEIPDDSSGKSLGSEENNMKNDADKKENKKNTSKDEFKTNSDSNKDHNLSKSEEEKQGEEDVDMDEDFDPSLLMPELSMEVDEVPVITNNDAPAPEHELNKSPLQLYDPIFSTFVDEMTGAEVDFDLTAEELELKAKTYGEKNPVQLTKIHCTACNIHLGSALDGQGNRFVHPLLKVLICKKCFHFYTSGEFEKDEDGSELYCRWCGQGGQVLCCSACEMVFCKKCIRINFDRKKLTEIQKSDDWLCFKCNPSQLIHLRIHCAEFMEYVQREMRMVSTAPNPEAYMNTDHCHCCLPQKKKQVEPIPSSSTQSKKRKRTTEEDPDYTPVLDRDSPTPLPTLIPSNKTSVLTATTSSVSKSPQLRVVTPQQVNRSKVQVVNTSAIRPQSNFIRASPVNARVQTPTPVLSTRQPVLRPIRPATTTKHEWFEKTVRSSARVNSNLSYTLTQLNRAQANATSVESLAVVHNKLQEILSSSINSLIQIRKNLRTEFIAGIKNIRFPPKNPPASTTSNTPPPLLHNVSSSKDDDDVIFIPSDPIPATVTSTSKTATVSSTPKAIYTTTASKGASIVSQSTLRLPEVSILKRTSGSTSSVTTISKAGSSGVTRITPSKSVNKLSSTTDLQPKGFLRVKSFSALQNVPAECITIPDDPADDEIVPVVEKDPLGDIDSITDDTSNRINGLANGDPDEEVRKMTNNTNKETADDQPIEVIADDEEVKSVKKAKIMLERSNEIDKLVKNKYGHVNGDTDGSVEK
ncbi:transcriptional regulator ATRX-like isoform X2 [Diorhabda sublineata]|uniref:transcriptional regulator ATRX-like isoform X2 n=1 Tax=Diorhabda sublineata TaxID=1163346 RepID=UPI0024E18DB0|nr:transcriptional regulator ATRX-like isoform X2 [Diorhabda sublineata]